ncbi:PepSY domain-containing protein [Shimia haliotis]|uniref:Peptidase propeptide and YPEB domain-containing protein n=1 Tax=Shimia haliotis TaxID=1280847 RepID=A0A1I4EVN2_9RHOB|nr:PepSY domain-containing protein [Shimia haliotis]SFL09805.1 Peptidase propeptide and YPEB domain-containing protein [Shimia haliotis]
MKIAAFTSIVAVAGTLFAVQAVAETDALPPLSSPLTFDQAIAIALDHAPGQIVEIGLEREAEDVVIDIEVLNDAGEEVEFLLDAQTGEILATWTDDDINDDMVNENDPDS